jgi:LysM domain
MNATRAAALAAHRTESYARPRPRLHVVYRADGSLALVAPPAAVPPAAAPPVTLAPVTLAPVTLAPVTLAPVPALPKAPPPLAAPPVALPVAPRPAAAPRPVAAPPRTARRTPATQPTTSPLRLTRRGRVVVAGLAVLLVSALSLLVAGAAQATSHAAPASSAGHSLTQVTVRPGQSLWSVAESADPGADTRLVIQRILQLNALHGDTVFAGERLWVPRG